MSETCIHCATRVGSDAKIQPTDVDGETFCPMCFVGKRMGDEPSRFNASEAAAVRCQLCGWVSVSFGAVPGQALRCGHCLRFTAMLMPLSTLQMTRQQKIAVEDIARDSGIKNPHRISR